MILHINLILNNFVQKIAITNVDLVLVSENELTLTISEIRKQFEIITEQEQQQLQNYYQAKATN